jgi:hypothetical protein
MVCFGVEKYEDQMPDRTVARIIAPAVLIATLIAGCQNTRPTPSVPDEDELAACAESQQAGIALRVSVSARDLPKELVTSEGVAKHYPFLARRLLIAVVPHGTAGQWKIISNELAITPVGGTFEGWATFSSAAVGVDVAPGRLRIDPFLTEGAIRAQTSTVDAVIRLGGGPFDQASITTAAMWDSAERPVSPDALQLTLTPLRHFTVYDAVKAKVTLRFVAQPARNAVPCRGTVETQVQLVDREVARPPLWDLGTSYKGGIRKRWLALYDPTTGPVRAIFTDPVAARGFALWAQQTAATHVGRFQLGTFESEDLDKGFASVPTDAAILESYRPITAEDRAALKVGPLAEP